MLANGWKIVGADSEVRIDLKRQIDYGFDLLAAILMGF
jgi:hypothetical protein